jgi:YbbR domain-containing protein
MNNPWILRSLSLTLALVLYFFVHSQNNSSEISLIVPVELQNIPEGSVVLLPESRQAKVTLRGPSFLMSDLVSQPPAFKLKLPEGAARRVELALSPDSLSVNSALEVIAIDPPKLDIVLDQMIHLDLPVDVPRIGSVPDGFRLISIQTVPGRIKLDGAETEIQNLKSVETYPIDMRNLTESVIREFPLRTPGKYSKLSLDRVRVDIEIESLSAEKTFEQIKVDIKGPFPKEFQLATPVVKIEVSGPKDKVENLKASDVKASVKYVEPALGEMVPRKLDLIVNLPEGVALVIAEPSQVRLTRR